MVEAHAHADRDSAVLRENRLATRMVLALKEQILLQLPPCSDGFAVGTVGVVAGAEICLALVSIVACNPSILCPKAISIDPWYLR